MPKRKAGAISAATASTTIELPPLPDPKRRAGRRAAPALKNELTNPDVNEEVIDSRDALRASPSAVASDDKFAIKRNSAKENPVAVSSDAPMDDEGSVPSLTRSADSESDLSEVPDESSDNAPVKKSRRKPRAKELAPVVSSRQAQPPSQPKPSGTGRARDQGEFLDPEADDDMGVENEEEMTEAISRPPPVNSSYLPLPWKGRLGYACLNTYLRYSDPPVFASRTCRIASILENRHPLKFPDQPPHATKNRPDREQPASIERGQRFVESLGLANARDCVKMLEWNDRYGIKFMRLSSEMFPFASHEEYGYKLAPFAADVLAEVGRTAARLGHRLTTHPGQFTQLGSPRQVVIDNAVRDLVYHAELLSLLKLPPQQDRDAVMIMHLGGVFGDKAETIQRFRENYTKLPEGVKKRLVLENDDVSYSVHDLLPVCEELNIPMVLDFHHHNIIFDADKLREGTKDIVDLFPRIIATWRRKNITPKMHYSEPTPPAVTGRQRRKHSPRVATLPPCPPDMDLMIEAKDKEQAVFELMRTFKLPGYETFNDIIPHIRTDENKPPKAPRSKAAKKKAEEEGPQEVAPPIPFEQVGMGGPEGRVYWPPGMEEWLRPKKRVVAKKGDGEKGKTPKPKGGKAGSANTSSPSKVDPVDADDNVGAVKAKGAKASTSSSTQKKGASAVKKAKPKMQEPTTEESEDLSTGSHSESSAADDIPAPRSKLGRRASRKQVNYADQSE